MRRNAFLFSLLFFCLSAVPVFAAIPLITTGTQGNGRFQLEHNPWPKLGLNSAGAGCSVRGGIARAV